MLAEDEIVTPVTPLPKEGILVPDPLAAAQNVVASKLPWVQNPDAHTAPWLDSSLWLAVLTPALLWLNQKYGVALDPGSLVAMVLPIATKIAASKVKQAMVATSQAKGTP